MTSFLAKSLIAGGLFVAALFAAFSMFILLGKIEKKANPEILKKIHRIAGWIFVLFLLVLGVFGANFLADLGDSVSPRAVIHYTLALFLFAIILLKVLSVRFFKSFLRFVPTLGMAAFILSLVIVMGSAGYYVLRGGRLPSLEVLRMSTVPSELQGDPQTVSRLFAQRCAGCHYADREESKMGPGLKGLFKLSSLPVSGRPVSVDSVLRQLKSPFKAMPAITGLAEQDLADLLAYLKTL